MNNPASLLLLLFLAVTFLQSAYDKLFYWKNNLDWLKSHFEKTVLKNWIPISLFLILILEVISGVLSFSGFIQLLYNSEKELGLYGGIFSCITLLVLLLGQRIAKDYDGARTIAIYFVPAVLAVYWLS
ncbi:MAG: DoxX family protein [Flavobacterium sp.]